MKNQCLSILLLLLLLGVNAKPTLAQTKSGIEVNPAFIEVNLEKPNEQKTVPIWYINHTNKPITLEFTAEDYLHQSENNSIHFVKPQSSPLPYSLAQFLKISNKTIQLQPGQKEKVDISITNTKDISPGGHYAAVLAKIPFSATQKNNPVSPAVSSLILLRKVGGEQFNLSLETISWPHQDLVLSYDNNVGLLYKNKGNTHIFPYGKVEIKDSFGKLLYKGIINTSSTFIFPQTSKQIYVSMYQVTPSWPISFNTMVVDSHDSLFKVQNYKKIQFVYIHPFVFIVPIILLLIVGVFLYRKK
jgi:hypothetical protein